MRIRLMLPAALLLCAALAAPAAAADFRVGMGDQSAAMFDNSAFQALKIKRVRFLVPYDWYKNAGQNAQVVAFMTRAHAARADVLVHFTARRGCFVNGRYKKTRTCRAPSVRTYTASVKRFRRAFPFARTFGAWNEANHSSQPTARNPKLAAKYFLALRASCRGCTIVAADVLDIGNMRPWLQTFLRNAKGKARIFGLHNYQDVNRLQTDGTRTLLATVPGQVWLTETGGILKFLPSFKRDFNRQAARTRNMFKLATTFSKRRRGLRSKVTQLYNYQWTGASSRARFDAGLTNPNGSPRKAYRTFKLYAARHAR